MRMSREEWAEHVEAWRSSGESASQYCDEQGLTPSSLRYWSKRIPRRAAVSEDEEVRFARVRRSDAGKYTEPAGSGVRVRVGRAELEVSAGFDEETLSGVLRVLAASEVGR
jgi:transposase